MNGLSDIVTGYEIIKRAGERTVLATVMKVKGPIPQKPGLRILVRHDRSLVGSCGIAGCDTILAHRASEMMDATNPRSVTLEIGPAAIEDHVREPNSVGVLHVLLEPFPPGASSLHLRFIESCLRSGTPGVVASIFRVEGEARANVGSHVLLHGNGRIEEDVRNPALSAAITEDCIRALQSKGSVVREYRLTEGLVEVLIEFMDAS